MSFRYIWDGGSWYIWDGGSYDFPEPDYDPRDDEWDAFVSETRYPSDADVESMEDHYADEINGVAVTPVDDIPPATAITNAPGQLRFSI